MNSGKISVTPHCIMDRIVYCVKWIAFRTFRHFYLLPCSSCILHCGSYLAILPAVSVKKLVKIRRFPLDKHVTSVYNFNVFAEESFGNLIYLALLVLLICENRIELLYTPYTEWAQRERRKVNILARWRCGQEILYHGENVKVFGGILQC